MDHQDLRLSFHVLHLHVSLEMLFYLLDSVRFSANVERNLRLGNGPIVSSQWRRISRPLIEAPLKIQYLRIITPSLERRSIKHATRPGNLA